MKLLYLSGYDSAGQQFNGIILHKALNAMGHQSSYAVMDKSLDEPGIYQLGNRFTRQVNRVATAIENRLSLQSVLPTLSLSLYGKSYYKQADLIHLQLLHAKQFFSLLNLPVISHSRPVVWTIHDPWITAGHCVHSLGCQRWKTGCGKCPDLTIPLAIRHDRTAINWRIKKWAMAHSKIHLVVASQWMRKRVEESPILQRLPCTIIPFGTDPAIFRPRSRKECREKLGIPPDARVAMLRWAPYNVLKGTDYAEKALAMLPPGTVTHLIILDSDTAVNQSPLLDRYTFIRLGWVDDREKLITALCASDLFIMPSLAETFGMMAVESMACGTPIVAFDGTSLPEVIQSPHAGMSVPNQDSRALAAAIQRIMTDPLLHASMVENGLKLVAREYLEKTYVERHVALYESLLK